MRSPRVSQEAIKGNLNLFPQRFSQYLIVCMSFSCLFLMKLLLFVYTKFPCIQISWTFFHLQFSRRRMAYKIWYNSPNTIYRAFFMHSQFSFEIMKLPPFSFYRSLSTFLFYPCMIFTERYIMFYAWFWHEIFKQGILYEVLYLWIWDIHILERCLKTFYADCKV